MIILVIGPPASGKTFFCSNQNEFKHIELDRLMPNVDTDTSNYKSYKEERRKVIDNILQSVDRPTIYDDTFHLYSMRKPFMRRAAELGVGYGIYQMPYQDPTFLLARNKKRTNSIPEESLMKVFNSFEPLRPSEQRYLITSLSQTLFIPQRVSEAIHHTTQQHELDLRLRKLTHLAIASVRTKDEHMINIILEERRSLLAESTDEKDLSQVLERFEKWLRMQAEDI